MESDYSTMGTHKLRIVGVDGNDRAIIGSKVVSFKVLPYSLTKDDGERIEIVAQDAEYSKKGAKPEVTVYFTGADGETEELKAGVDYTISYKNNKKAASKDAAKAPTVIIKGKGRFTGSATQTFTIYR
jgi:hypothetical protein